MTQSSDPGGGVSAEEVIARLRAERAANPALYVGTDEAVLLDEIARLNRTDERILVGFEAGRADTELRYAPLLAAADQLDADWDHVPNEWGGMETRTPTLETLQAFRSELNRLRSGEGGEPK